MAIIMGLGLLFYILLGFRWFMEVPLHPATLGYIWVHGLGSRVWGLGSQKHELPVALKPHQPREPSATLDCFCQEPRGSTVVSAMWEWECP